MRYPGFALLGLLATAGPAAAQTPTSSPPVGQTPPAAVQAPSLLTGFIDFGVRGTSASGDAARYERYRDFGDGLIFENLQIVRDRNDIVLNVLAEHVGRRDQRLFGQVSRPGTARGWAMWDQIPMLMSNSARTLFLSPEESDSVLTIPDALQTQVQTTPAQLASVFNTNSDVFDLRSRRYIFDTGVEWLATRELTLKATVRSTRRDGTIPYGGSFGHSPVVELPAPVHHTLNDVEGNAEWTRGRLLVRGGYVGSFFTNHITQLTFDSPLRATDTPTASSRGRLSLPPSNSMFSVNGLATVRMPGRSRATAYFSVGALKDAEAPLMPQTVNSANTPAPLERNAVEGEARTTSMNLSFSSRPVSRLDLSVRYRHYDFDNRTPVFHLQQRVSFDYGMSTATMSSLGGISSPEVHTEPFSVGRGVFEAEARFDVGFGLNAALGFVRTDEDRTHRIIEDSTDNAVRVTVDAIGHQWFSLRTRYEHAQKRGTATDEAQRELFRIGEQPGIRHYDVASRDRDRVTLLGTITPPAVPLSFSASVAVGKDDYIESLFGLRDNTHRVYGVGVDFLPGDRYGLSASYSFERYAALSRSRQANPPSGAGVITYEQFLALSAGPTTVQVADASRNWATDARDRAHGFTLTGDVRQIGGKLDLTIGVDLNRASADYTYITGPVLDRTLPEEVVIDVSTLPAPTQLPSTRSDLDRATFEALYNLTDRVGLGVSVWHERYRVEDFTLDEEANQQLVRGSAVLLGYLYRPYTATTGAVRLFYRW